MELVLALQKESQICVTCDDHYSHTTDLHPLLFQNEQDARILFDDPTAYGKKLYAALFPPKTIAQPTNCATRGTLGVNRLLDHCRLPQAHLLNVGTRCVMHTSKKDSLNRTAFHRFLW